MLKIKQPLASFPHLQISDYKPQACNYACFVFGKAMLWRAPNGKLPDFLFWLVLRVGRLGRTATG